MTPGLWFLAIVAGLVVPCALIVTLYAHWVRKTEMQGRSVDSLLNGHLVAQAALVIVVVVVTTIGIIITV